MLEKNGLKKQTMLVVFTLTDESQPAKFALHKLINQVSVGMNQINHFNVAAVLFML